MLEKRADTLYPGGGGIKQL